MTPKQQRVVDFIVTAAITNKTPFHFEIGQPRDDREGASIRLSRKPFPTMFSTDRLGITPDGHVFHTEFTQSYDRELSAFIKRVIGRAKKL